MEHTSTKHFLLEGKIIGKSCNVQKHEWIQEIGKNNSINNTRQN